MSICALQLRVGQKESAHAFTLAQSQKQTHGRPRIKRLARDRMLNNGFLIGHLDRGLEILDGCCDDIIDRERKSR